MCASSAWVSVPRSVSSSSNKKRARNSESSSLKRATLKQGQIGHAQGCEPEGEPRSPRRGRHPEAAETTQGVRCKWVSWYQFTGAGEHPRVAVILTI